MSIKPDSVADDLRWETMALEGNVLHPKMLIRAASESQSS
jgi:hypothetical protein